MHQLNAKRIKPKQKIIPETINAITADKYPNLIRRNEIIEKFSKTGIKFFSSDFLINNDRTTVARQPQKAPALLHTPILKTNGKIKAIGKKAFSKISIKFMFFKFKSIPRFLKYNV